MPRSDDQKSSAEVEAVNLQNALQTLRETIEKKLGGASRITELEKELALLRKANEKLEEELALLGKANKKLEEELAQSRDADEKLEEEKQEVIEDLEKQLESAKTALAEAVRAVNDLGLDITLASLSK
ncbi:MAG: hypothetical protein ABH837_03615 [bacterium]